MNLYLRNINIVYLGMEKERMEILKKSHGLIIKSKFNKQITLWHSVSIEIIMIFIYLML
jgi:hypothetical protein